MLDVSQYTGSRMKRGLDIIEFWRPDHSEKLRRATLIYDTSKNSQIGKKEDEKIEQGRLFL